MLTGLSDSVDGCADTNGGVDGLEILVEGGEDARVHGKDKMVEHLVVRLDHCMHRDRNIERVMNEQWINRRKMKDMS